MCPRCGKAEETATHRFWECEHNDFLEQQWGKAERPSEDASNPDNKFKRKACASDPNGGQQVIVAIEGNTEEKKDQGAAPPEGERKDKQKVRVEKEAGSDANKAKNVDPESEENFVYKAPATSVLQYSTQGEGDRKGGNRVRLDFLQRR